MTKVDKYFKTQSGENVKKFTNGGCEVYGCPLTGTLSSGINSPYYCRFHFGIKFEHQNDVTIQIKYYQSLINILDNCLRPDIQYDFNLQKAEIEIRGYLIRKNLGNLYDEKSLYKTSLNILNFLHNKIRPKIKGEENA
jgi:hypothetical protein